MVLFKKIFLAFPKTTKKAGSREGVKEYKNE